MSRRKLLAFCPTFLPHIGGAENTALNLYNEMFKQGVDVTFLTLTPTFDVGFDQQLGFKVIRLLSGRVKSRALKFLLLQLQLIFYFLFYCRFHKINSIHLSYGLHASLASIVNRILLGPKIIISEFHLGSGKDIVDQKENGVMVNRLCGYAYKAAHSLHAISKDNARYIAAVSGRSDVLVTPQAANSKLFNPSKACKAYRERLAEGAQFLLCSCSRIVPRKNIEGLLDLAKFLLEKNLSFKIVIIGTVEEGCEEYLALLKAQTKKRGLEKNITFAGYLDDEEIAKTYASSDLYVSCSKYEGFGLSFAESMSSGTPIVTFNTKSISDYLENDVHGFYSEKNSLSEMTEKICSYLTNPGHLDQMSKNVELKAKLKLSWRAYCNSLIKLIYN